MIAKDHVGGVGIVDGCDCYHCLSHQFQSSSFIRLPLSASRMSLCPTCGNKWCPKATHHNQLCSGSNESGQVGSRYA